MIFSVTLPSDGTNADVRDYNDPILAILAGLNGQLDDNNISSLSGSKITSNTLPEAALTDALKTGWLTQSILPTSIVALGNRSYTVNYGSSVASIKSPGMRNRFTRTNAVGVQCTSLNGTTQYFTKASPSKITWTDDFVCAGWIKITAYGNYQVIASRYNGTSGWAFAITATGAIELIGFNAGAVNKSYINSYQSVPLNKWVHVAAQLDMSTFTATTTTSYTMIDGIDSPAFVSRGGTNPTALIQAGSLEIGSQNAGTSPLGGKLAQIAIYNAKVTQATILASMNQPLAGTETSLASGYSFSNSVTDLNTTTPNDLSVGGGSAVATNADSPFGNSGVSTTLEYGITMSVAANGLSETVQVPEGCVLPTTGGVSALSYSQQRAPYLFPAQRPKWRLSSILKSAPATTSNATYGTFNSGGWKLSVPVGSFRVGYQIGLIYSNTVTPVYFNLSNGSALSGLAAGAGASASPYGLRIQSPSAASTFTCPAYIDGYEEVTSMSIFSMYTLGATTSVGIDSTVAVAEIFAENAYL